MADDWQIGDLALCVLGMNETPTGFDERAPNQCPKIIEMLAPAVGSNWQVSSVAYVFRKEEQRELVYLGLNGQSSGYLYDARHFRKIKPLTDEERREALADLRESVSA